MFRRGISVGGNSIGKADGCEKAPQTPAAVEGLRSKLHARQQGFCAYFASSGGMFERAWGECLFGGVGEGGSRGDRSFVFYAAPAVGRADRFGNWPSGARTPDS